MHDLPPKALCGRLAPSPTGALHLGNARTFLITWLSLRSRGGRVVMRMEDLDHPKVKPGASAQVFEDLAWLGLDWDEGPDKGGRFAPYTQSERRAHYRRALEAIRAKGLAYPCTCSRRDVEAAQSAPHAGEEGPRYSGRCRDRFESFAAARAALPEGRLPAWRFRVPDHETVFEDGFCGRQRDVVQGTVGDFVLARDEDGAGYMLAVVVDDAAMGITEVLRGDDLISATHRQLHLYTALGLAPPTFIHVPLVVGPDGRRLAKRHGDTRISALREAGVPADVVVGWLASSCGWATPGERLMAGDLLKGFDLRTLPNEAVVWDGNGLGSR